MPPDAAGLTVVLEAGCSQARRTLGPLAWAALEVIASHSNDVDGSLVASFSVRALATELAVAKDTAARALDSLHRSGLVERAQTRGDHGKFGRGRYLVTLPAGVLTLDVGCVSMTSSPPRQSSTTRSRRRPVAQLATATVQLALLEAE
jgi:DNA-binding MarR family transcriptional regulator